jgi:hypothetical protein
MSQRRTRLVGRSGPWICSHPSDSLVYLLKGVITLRLEFAHCTVIGVDRDLFFVLDLEQGRVFLDNLGAVSGWSEEMSRVLHTRLENIFIGCCS